MRDEEGNYLVMKLMPLYALMCLSSITLNVCRSCVAPALKCNTDRQSDIY